MWWMLQGKGEFDEGRNRMRILCIDDEPLMRKMVELAVKEAKPDAEGCQPENEHHICYRFFRIQGYIQSSISSCT